ncbi:MAG: DUF6385 domain-containing protein [Clostridia bacterium]|nr:DUF6385 domain-containing protein [Clostridia bacterium]
MIVNLVKGVDSMAGVAVYQDSPECLKSLQYGYDGNTPKILRLDAYGRQVVTTESGSSIEVTSTDLDIRNLSNTQDNVVVYGNDGTSNVPIKTDNSGALQVVFSKSFMNATENVTTSDLYTGTIGRDTSLHTVHTFFINNIGSNPAIFKIQISPDGILWIDDGGEFSVDPSTAKAANANRFAHYTRIAYRSNNSNSTTNLSITFQAQS